MGKMYLKLSFVVAWGKYWKLFRCAYECVRCRSLLAFGSCVWVLRVSELTIFLIWYSRMRFLKNVTSTSSSMLSWTMLCCASRDERHCHRKKKLIKLHRMDDSICNYYIQPVLYPLYATWRWWLVTMMTTNSNLTVCRMKIEKYCGLGRIMSSI